MNDRTRWYDEASKRYMTPREDWAKKGLLTEEPTYFDHNDRFLRLLAIAETRAGVVQGALDDAKKI